MRYILEWTLLDKTKLICITSNITKDAARQKALAAENHLLKLGVVKGAKFNITPKTPLKFESWDQSTIASNYSGLKPYSIIVMDFNGHTQQVNNSYQGFKTAYNDIMRQLKMAYNMDSVPFMFIYDTSQKPLVKSSVNEAKKTMSDTNELKRSLSVAVNKISKTGDITLSEDVKLLCYMIYDYAKGTYKKVPAKFILIGASAIIYFISPVDMIPDFIPVAGQMDDVAMLSKVIQVLHGELSDYKIWKQQNSRRHAG